MKITKIYYEELRSECINGKWSSKKIGAEVSVSDGDVLSENLEYVKNYVKRNLDRENYTKEKQALIENIKRALKNM